MQTRHIVVARFAVSVLVVSFGHVRHSPAQTAARPDSHVCRGDKSLQGLAIRLYSVRLDLVNAGGNVIPVPRSNRGTFYSQVPGFLKVFNPTFGIERDRQMGVLGVGTTSTNLLTLPSTIRGHNPDETNTKLDLDLQGSRSLDKQFYETSSELNLDRRWTGKLMEDLSVFTAASVNRQPLGEGRHFNNAVRAGGAVKFRPGVGGMTTLFLGVTYRWVTHRLFGKDLT